MKIFSLIERIKSDSRFCKKERITLIDDFETFKTFIKLQAYKKFPLQRIILVEKFKDKFEKEFANMEGVSKTKIDIVDEEKLRKVLKIDNPSICALINIKQDFFDLENFFSGGRFCVVLDSIQNPWNMGGIFRTNSAFSIFDVIVLNNSVFPFSPRVIRASKGFVFEQNIRMLNNVRDYLDEKCISLIFENKKDSLDIRDKKIGEKIMNSNVMLVFGNEEYGVVSKEIFKNYISVKIVTKIDSLNVFSAHSIACFYLTNLISSNDKPS